MKRTGRDGSDTAALRLVQQAAARWLACPSNSSLASAIGARGPAAGAAALARLEEAGMISVCREFGWRTVTILEFRIKCEGEDA